MDIPTPVRTASLRRLVYALGENYAEVLLRALNSDATTATLPGAEEHDTETPFFRDPRFAIKLGTKSLELVEALDSLIKTRAVSLAQLARAANAIWQAHRYKLFETEFLNADAILRRPAEYLDLDGVIATLHAGERAAVLQWGNQRSDDNGPVDLDLETTMPSRVRDVRLRQPVRSELWSDVWPGLVQALADVQPPSCWWPVVMAVRPPLLVPSGRADWSDAGKQGPWQRPDVERLLVAGFYEQGVAARALVVALSCSAECGEALVRIALWHFLRHPSVAPNMMVAPVGTAPSHPPGTGAAHPTKRSRPENGEAGPIHGLAFELLSAILGWLPLDDLVRCRQVCHRWRTVIADLGVRDAQFAYRCGACDLAAVVQLPGVQLFANFPFEVPWCTCGRLLPLAYAATVRFVADTASDTDHLGQPEEPGSDLRAVSTWPYHVQHGCNQTTPPDRWQRLRPARDLALELTRLLAQVDSRVPLDAHNGASQWPWAPLFLWLPPSVVRPTTTFALRKLVKALTTKIGGSRAALDDLLYRVLSDKSSAAAWYGDGHGFEPPSTRLDQPGMGSERGASWDDRGHHTSWEDDHAGWEDAWRTITPSSDLAFRVVNAADAAGEDPYVTLYYEMDDPYHYSNGPGPEEHWTRHRYLARRALVVWKVALALGLSRESIIHGSSVGGRINEMKDTQITDSIEANIHAFDRAAAQFQARCPLSVCDFDDGDRSSAREVPAYFVGLSPGGHLVGAMTIGTWFESAY